VRAILAVTIFALLSGCDTPAPGNSAAGAPQPRAIARTVLETEESARFRLAARELYSALGTLPCSSPKGLEPERAALKAFEARLGTTGAAFQLAVAQADIRYRPECPNNGPLDEVRARIADNLAILWKLLPRLDQVPVQEPIPARSAEYRALVGKLVTTVQPLCTLSSQATDAEILAPSLDAVRQFQARLPGAAYRHHYAIAKADVDLEQSMAVVDCMTPLEKSPDRLRDDILADVRRQIAALQAIRL
jgi:hypothetical protein